MAERTKQPKKPRQRNPPGTGSFRERKPGYWEGRIVLPDGERVSVYGSSLRDVQKKARSKTDDARRGLDGARGAMSVKAYMERWIQDLHDQGRVREGTWRAYSGHVKHHIVPHLGRVPLRELTPHHVNQMLSKITRRESDGSTSKKTGVSPTTANRVRSTLRIALGDAVSERIVPDNAAKLSKARKERRDRVKPLEHDQILQLLEALKDHHLGPLIRVAITTGLRQGELLALEWRDVDFNAGELHVRHTLTRDSSGNWQRSDTKTDQSRRTIKLTPSTIAAFHRQRDINAENELKATQFWKRRLLNPGYRSRAEEPQYSKPHTMDLVFLTSRGNPHHGPTFTHALQELIEAAGLPRQRFHDLRHAAASLLLSEGSSLFDVKETLGHAQYGLTANLYGHMTDRRAEDVSRAMARALGEKEEADDDRT